MTSTHLPTLVATLLDGRLPMISTSAAFTSPLRPVTPSPPASHRVGVLAGAPPPGVPLKRESMYTHSGARFSTIWGPMKRYSGGPE